jgi:hypothetical protein
MTEPAHQTHDADDDDMDFLDAQMTPEEWVETVDDVVAEAVEDLMENEAGLMRLADFLKRRASELSAMAAEMEPQEIDEEEAD